MNSNRLLQISLFVDHNDSVIDIGCDHALLDIYLIENKLCKKALATDISENALEQGINNIKKHDLESYIPTVLSDGLKNIEVSDYNTLVLSGMGAHTIIEILSNKHKLTNIQKILISSNNDYPLVRHELNRIGYYLEDEKVVEDKNHFYPIMKFVKKKKKNKINEIRYGLLKISNIPYYEYLIRNNRLLIKQIKHAFFKKMCLYLDNHYYQKYLKKITGRKLK
ncbi:MAG: SAM-dependent methyltransferase [Bacilli bacterium]|nr:SAM-dependent methyltransferase [Bacilli bacterium]